MDTVKTVTLPRGAVVLAKDTKWGLSAVTYANYKQANARLATLGPGWALWKGLGIPIYIRKI